MRKWHFVFLAIVALLIAGVCAAETSDEFLARLQKELAKRGNPWIAGKTAISELPQEQLRDMFHPLPVQPIPDSKRTKVKIPKAPPASFDWRSKDGSNWMTPVEDQGNCGSCWAFCTVACFEAALKIYAGNPNENSTLSEQFVVSCDYNNNGCGGGSNDYAFEFFKTTGVPDASCFAYYSYGGSTISCDDSRKCSDWASRVKKITQWGYLPSDAAGIKTKIMDAPVATAVYASKDFLYYKGGVYQPILDDPIIPELKDKLTPNHGVCVCGWNDGQNAWIIKNSWGTGWGTQGYGGVGYGQIEIFGGYMDVWLQPAALTKPNIALTSCQLNESNDGVWDPGEAINLTTTLGNTGVNATNVTGVLSSTASYVTISNSSFNFGSIIKNGSANNSSNPYHVTASSGAPSPVDVPFKLHVTADGGYSTDISFTEPLGMKPGAIDGNFPSPGPDTGTIYGLAFDGTNLWATEYIGSVIYKLDPSTGTVRGTIPAPAANCTDICWDGNALWVNNSTTKKTYKLSTSGSVLTSFASPATYPTGLAFDGTNLWTADRDGYKIYKLTTSGATVSSFSIPVSPQPLYGPRGLAFEPGGSDGGSLLLFMTHFSGSASQPVYDSAVVWEISRNGQLISGHHFQSPPVNGRAVETDPSTCKYWVNSIDTLTGAQNIYIVKGFYRCTGTEETEISREISPHLLISPNPAQSMTLVNFYVPDTRKVKIDIYDVSGKQVRSLVDKTFQAGNYVLTWDGKSDAGQKVASGVYFYKLDTDKCTPCNRKAMQKKGIFLQ